MNENDTNTSEDLASRVECNYLDRDSFKYFFSNNKDYMSFFHINISTLTKHFDELTLLLEDLNHVFKVVAISETKVKVSTKLRLRMVEQVYISTKCYHLKTQMTYLPSFTGTGVNFCGDFTKQRT